MTTVDLCIDCRHDAAKLCHMCVGNALAEREQKGYAAAIEDAAKIFVEHYPNEPVILRAIKALSRWSR